MDIYYKIVIGLLLVIAAVLFIRVIQYKRQMRIFADKLKARLDGGVDQDIHVEYFDGDILSFFNRFVRYIFQEFGFGFSLFLVKRCSVIIGLNIVVYRFVP